MKQFFRRGPAPTGSSSEELSHIDQGLMLHTLDPMLTFGRISAGEARALIEVVSSLGPGPVIEIGTLFGFSTTMLAVGAGPNRQILTVDNYTWNPSRLEPAQHRYLTRRVLSALPNVQIVDQNKDDFWAAYDGPAPALVFIDADHSYEPTVTDIQAAIRVGASVICGHDYADGFPGVVQAVGETGGVKSLCETFWVLQGETP